MGQIKRLVNSGSSTSAGALTLSPDKKYLVLTGYDAAPGTASITGTTSSAVNRVVALVDYAETINTTTALTDAYSGDNIRGAVTNDGTQFWLSGTATASPRGAVYAALGATTSTQLSTTITNVRTVNIFNNQLYVSSSTGTYQGVSTVGTGLPTTSGQTISLLPGFPTTSGPSAYAFSMNTAGTILYVADDRTTTSGGIQKWTFSSGTWTLQYTVNPATGVGCRGIAVDWSGANPVVYATGTNSKIYKLTDAGSGSTASLLFEAATNTAFRGIAFSPVNSSEPVITLNDNSQVTAGNIQQGATDQILSQFSVAVSAADAYMNSLTFSPGGTFSAGDITGFKLYTSTTNTFPGGTALKTVDATGIGSGGTVTFSSLGQVCAVGNRYFWITADVSGSAGVNNTINIPSLGAANFTFAAGTPAGTVSAGGVKTIIVALPEITLSSSHPSAGNINQNSTNNVLYSIQAVVNVANATLTGMTVTTGGSYLSGDIQTNGFKFWLNSANNLSGAVQIGTSQPVTASGNNVTISGLNQAITTGTKYLLVTADVSYNASPARNISIASTSFSNITFVSGIVSGTNPISAGNVQTFAEVTPGIAIAQVGPDAGNISIPKTNAILYQLSFAVTQNATDFTGITLTTGGTYQISDLAENSFKLWYNTANAIGSAAQIGTSQAIVASGNSITFSGMASTIAAGTTGYVWLTADVVSGAVSSRTISITSTPFSNILFSAGTLTGTDPAAAGGTQTFATPPSMTELVIPQFVGSKSAASTNNTRTPIAICLKIDNLNPSTVYDVQAQLGLTSDAATSYGAGNIWNGTAFSGSTRSGAFTTDISGSSGPFWVYIQPTGNATRFDAGAVHNLRLGYTITGGVMPGSPSFISTKTITALDIPTTARTAATTSDDGAFVKGYGFSAASGKYVLLFNNTAGSGDPLFSTQIRTSTYTNSTQSDLPASINAVFSQTAPSSVGDFAAVVPIGANNPNGIRRIEVRNADNTLAYAMVSGSGRWNGMASYALTRRQVDSISFANFSVKMALEGYYNAVTNTLAMHDTVRISLANTTAPYAKVDSATAILDSAGFTAYCNLKSAGSGTYYLVIQHRNAVETWSKTGGESFNPGVVQEYDFTTAAAQSYGDNAVYKGTKWCIYSADVTGDGFIDFSDLSLVDNDQYNFVSGYVVTDVTGDQFVDFSDLSLTDNNQFNFIGKVTPAGKRPVRMARP